VGIGGLNEIFLRYCFIMCLWFAFWIRAGSSAGHFGFHWLTYTPTCLEFGLDNDD
jgi:hypothetical protein